MDTPYLDPTSPPGIHDFHHENDKGKAAMNDAKVTVKGPVESRNVTTKSGPKTIYFQRSELETDSLRVQIELEVDGPNMGHPVGAVREWDVIADLVPGRYGIELARRMTLREASAKPNVAAVK